MSMGGVRLRRPNQLKDSAEGLRGCTAVRHRSLQIPWSINMVISITTAYLRSVASRLLDQVGEEGQAVTDAVATEARQQIAQ